ncbi:MAG: hypothetical protein QOF60_3469 [Actinomycetota bacterium]|nr:hypothetical protein [Actinomycetota bacterium]
MTQSEFHLGHPALGPSDSYSAPGDELLSWPENDLGVAS